MGRRKEWEPVEGENDNAFAGFEVFRGLGPGRSIRAAAEKLGKSAATCEKLSAKYAWQARALAWDAHVAAREQSAELEEVRAFKRRLVRKLLSSAETALDHLTSDRADEASFRELASSVGVLVKGLLDVTDNAPAQRVELVSSTLADAMAGSGSEDRVAEAFARLRALRAGAANVGQ